eukprot:scaffold1883_cov396-Prasinococcus_capsulatus_cf.AAC.35
MTGNYCRVLMQAHRHDSRRTVRVSLVEACAVGVAGVFAATGVQGRACHAARAQLSTQAPLTRKVWMCLPTWPQVTAARALLLK